MSKYVGLRYAPVLLLMIKLIIMRKIMEFLFQDFSQPQKYRVHHGVWKQKYMALA